MITLEIKNKIISLHFKGVSVQEIAIILGCKISRVGSYKREMKKMGVYLPKIYHKKRDPKAHLRGILEH